MRMNLNEIINKGVSVEFCENPVQALSDIDRAFAEYPHRRVLLTFRGIFTSRSPDGVPVDSSDLHKIIYRVVSLRKDKRKTGEVYLLDRQENCVCWDFYCGRDSSYIRLNKFDEQINPEKIKRFLIERDNTPPSYAFGEAVIEKAFGKTDNFFGFISRDLTFLNTNYLKINAFRQGGTRHERELTETASITSYSSKKDSPYQLTRGFINKIRSTYVK